MKLAVSLYSHIKSMFGTGSEERSVLGGLEELILTSPGRRCSSEVGWGGCRRVPAPRAALNAAQATAMPTAMPGLLVLSIYFYSRRSKG